MELIKIDVAAKKTEYARYKGDVIAVGMVSDDKKPTGAAADLDKKLGGAIAKLLALGDFKGKAGSSAVVYSNGAIAAQRVMVVGLGERKKITGDTVRKAVAGAAKEAIELGAETLGLALHQAVDSQLDADVLGELIASSVYFGAYRWDEFVSTNKENGKKARWLKAEIIDTDAAKLNKMATSIKVGAVVGEAQNWARTIANRPGNVINPPVLAEIAKKAARETKGLKCTVFNDVQIKQKGMGGLAAVGSGSANKPRFIVLEYRGGKAKDAPVALVGKAITFDSGGISIKPSQGMEDMKLDKSGGVAVIATMKAAAKLKLAINVLGIVPSAENLPSGTSVRPGDIVRTFSGKTVEIQNTDAEGRMVLCDGIAYAVKHKARAIVDIATLTGACMVALGKYKAGLMSNNDALARTIEEAAAASGEAVWRLPIGEEYLDEMKSKIADLKNIGSRWGGACNAAAFLGEFAGETPWAHIDMAGVDLFESPKSFAAVGSSGYGVRLLVAYLRKIGEK